MLPPWQLRREESLLDFSCCTAGQLHNRVRGFAGWPGTSGRFLLQDEDTGAAEGGKVHTGPKAVNLLHASVPL